MCRGSPPPSYNMIQIAVPTLCKAIKNRVIDEIDIETDCCWAIAYMSEGQKSRIQKVVDTGVVPTII